MKKYLTILVAVLALASCTKEFDVQDSGYLSGTQASELSAADPAFLTSYVNGMYAYMVAYGGNHDDFGFLSITHNLELMCQTIAIGGTLNWGTFDIPHGYGAKEYRRCYQPWNNFFTLLSKANEIIDFFGAEDPTDATLRGYLGQSYAVRAFCYSYLMQIFQDPVSGNYPNAVFEWDRPAVPIYYANRDGKSMEESDAVLGRNTLRVVADEVERNIALAEPLLKDYVRSSKNEVDYSVLQGIAARYYLYTQQWDKAATAAKAAQAGYTVIDASNIDNGYMEVTNPEVMWGFNHSTETMTSYASFFSHMGNDSAGYGGIGQSVHCMDKQLYDQIPDTDVRKGLFNTPDGDPTCPTTGGKLPYASRKFGHMDSWLQDYIYMRVEEMILIQAEAQVRAGSANDAATTLATLMAKRDAAWSKSAVTLDEVLTQRKVELWGEGFEYFDIRRNGQGINRKYDGSNHLVANQFEFPAHDPSWNMQIPLSELQENPNISEEENNDYVDPTV